MRRLDGVRCSSRGSRARGQRPELSLPKGLGLTRPSLPFPTRPPSGFAVGPQRQVGGQQDPGADKSIAASRAHTRHAIGFTSLPTGGRRTIQARTRGSKSCTGTIRRASRSGLLSIAALVARVIPSPRATSDRRRSELSASIAIRSGRWGLLEAAPDHAAEAAAILIDDPGKRCEVSQHRRRRQIQRIERRQRTAAGCRGRPLRSRSADSFPREGKTRRRSISLRRSCSKSGSGHPVVMRSRRSGKSPRRRSTTVAIPTSDRYGEMPSRNSPPTTPSGDNPVLRSSSTPSMRRPLRIGFAAGGGGLQGFRLPVEQGDAKLFFQTLDAAAHAWLGEMKPRRSSNDRAGLHHRQKRLEVPCVHAHLA